jgi:hypothetical protein
MKKILFSALLVLLASSPLLAATPKPVYLPPEYLSMQGSVLCGFYKGVWRPGSMKGSKFLSYSSASVIAKRKAKKLKANDPSKKRQIKKLLKKARELKKRNHAENQSCLSLLPPGTYPYPTPTPGVGQAVRFNLSDAVGIAQESATGTSSLSYDLTLNVVTQSGELRPALVGSSVAIYRFLIAPNNKLYVLFVNKVNLETGQYDSENGCLLAEINVVSGVPSCIDSDVDSISWGSGGYSTFANPPIQFDATGAIYYLAFIWGDHISTVLRRHLNGQTVDLINENININNFKVMLDGTIFLSGYNDSNYARWLRRLSNQNSLQNVLANTASLTTFLYPFPNQKLYFGMYAWEDGFYGVYSVDPNTAVVDDKAWIHPTSWISRATHYECLSEENQLYSASCGYNPYLLLTTIDNKVFGVVGEPSRGKLLQYYPVVARPDISIEKIGVAQGLLQDLIIAGVDANQRNRLHLYNTTTEQEFDLMPNDDIEIYRLHYIVSQNKIMFDGLRFSDNKYVIGWYDFNTGQFAAAPTGSSKLVDFQTFY